MIAPRRSPRSIVVAVCIACVSLLISWEARTNRIQARQLSGINQSVSYAMAPGLSPSIRFPRFGPYDQRLGYTRLPYFIDRLRNHGYEVAAQSRFSPGMRKLSDWGVFPIYREKTQAGLRVLDSRGRPFFESVHPPQVFANAEDMPPLIIDTLLFIENRELLGGSRWRNPAIELTRLARAALDFGLQKISTSVAVPGASTLATQLEKFRHSPGGVTASPGEKARQMATASLRAYREGPDTTDARRHLVVDYVNSIGLAALPGYGEVIGLASGLELWHGAGLEEIAAALSEGEGTALARRALAYKQVLSLLLAAKRPTYYLVDDRQALARRTDAFLRLLAEQGVISESLRDAALAAPLHFKSDTRSQRGDDAGARRAAGPVRARLVRMLGVADYYELERLDLSVHSTIDRRVQLEAERVLDDLLTPEGVARAGLLGPRMLDDDDPSRVVYSLMVYERGSEANLLRVQTDTLDSAFAVNDLVMLDLGSTAKLRTLASYLAAVADLHQRLRELSPEALRSFKPHRRDVLSAWAADYLSSAPSASLAAMLDAALDRRYSAAAGERFFTGGGIHIFRNFDNRDNARVVSVREAFLKSINLPFIRLMRDLVNHIVYTLPSIGAEALEDPHHPERDRYLRRYAERDGAAYMHRFYLRYHGLSAEQALSKLVERYRPSSSQLAAITGAIYDSVDRGRRSLGDRAYLAGVHPLELWTLSFLSAWPDASEAELREASLQTRLDAYAWLFKTERRAIQDRAIASELEIDAFGELHRRWRRLGYPFAALVPSYATAIGSSADRPAALAGLAGIIVNQGIRQPNVRVQSLRFAEGTPYETVVRPRSQAGQRVMPAAVASLLSQLLIETVESGTGRRARVQMFDDSGWAVPIGGKTGTGDHDYKFIGSRGQLLESHAVSRSAAFVFTIGERFYGTVTAYVLGREAGEYVFTSSLATQVFHVLAPTLQQLLSPPSLVGVDGAVVAQR